MPFAGITPAPSQEKGQDLFPTGNWRAIRPVYRDKMPPCNNACGTNEKIQGYLDLVKRGKYLDAYALIKEDMPFPSVTGRVCYHPCEQACNRGKYDEAISIRAVERFLGDLGQALPHDVVKAGPPNGKKVAVVGSGPAGHSAAYQLARLGYAVTILEKSPKAGGLNRGGIPDWVLPQDVLDREIERLVELGHHDQDQHRGRQGRHLGRPEERTTTPASWPSASPSRTACAPRAKTRTACSTGCRSCATSAWARRRSSWARASPSSAAATPRSTARAKRSGRAPRK